MLNLEPLHPHDLLSWMAIPTYPGVYILGSFARHVTIYSQQMRAFNLVDALCKTGQLLPGARVAVVGGGVAGVTAAAAAAVRGADVTIIESDEHFFPIQRNAGNRYLHPHIYDWPLYELEAGREDKAGFPFLDWDADEAGNVFSELKDKWKELFDKHAARLRKPNKLMKTRVTGIHKRADAGAIELTLERSEADKVVLENLQAEIVILALGFGREFSSSDLQTYWEQAPLDAVTQKKLRWLVSGYGDGGLTDLMRLCINDFRHHKFVNKYESDPNVRAKLRKLLSDNKTQSVRGVFEELSKQLKDESLITTEQLRKDTEVIFNAPKNYLESEGSSILNKFIVFQLEQRRRFERQEGWLNLPVPTPNPENRKYTIQFIDKDKNIIKTDYFDRLVVRHGPERPFSESTFPEIWKATEDLRKRWEAQSQSNDRTRVQIWDPADFDPSTAPHPIMPKNEPQTDVDLSCVVVESTKTRPQTTLSSLVSTAINSHKKPIGVSLKPPRKEGNIKADFETIKINEALRSQEQYNRAVNLLCKADVAVIDVTGYEPGVMVLLGIRSAVRRGVTIVTTNQKLDSAEWSNLPFNLKELYPLSLFSDTKKSITSPEHPNQIVGGTIAKALAHYNSLQFYQDVPAYEAVRRFDAASKEEAQRILWLCSFRPRYDAHAEYIESGYIAAFAEEKNERGQYKYPLERITEIVSPQVVTQKLYSAIRRTVLCLVDWSFWSPNVFFELGVRLAVSNFGPICLLASDALEAPPELEQRAADNAITNELLEQREMLKKLFRPLEYSLEAESQEMFEEKRQELFDEIRARHSAMQDYETPGRSRLRIPPTFGAFPFDHTYKFVGGLLPLQNEPGAWSAHDFLTTTADSLIGASTPTDLSLPVLYANVNNDLDKQARDAAKEALIAAWYYLRNRHPEMLYKPGKVHKDYADLSFRLPDLLRASNDKKDEELLKLVQQEIRVLMKVSEEPAYE